MDNRVAAIPRDPEGLKRARELAQWKLGYRAWADAILEAYFNPESSEWKEAHEGIYGDGE